MVEAGVNDYAVTGWYALIGPAELPADIVTRLQTALKGITSNADFVENMKNGGYTIDLTDGEALKARVKAYEQMALVELRRELVGEGDEDGLREISKIVAPPRRAERPLVSGSTNRQNRARRRYGG